MAKSTEPVTWNRTNDALGWFSAAVVMLCTAWLVHGDNSSWDDDRFWWVFGVIGLVCGLLGVRSLARGVRERQAADAGEGAA